MPSGFTINGVDIDSSLGLVPKSYLIDRYPELANTFKTAGLWTWGTGSLGQMGDNTLAPKSSPVQTISGGANWKVTTFGASSTVSAIKTDGTLWTWGGGTNGQMGDNTLTNKSSPVQTISLGTNWKQVSNGAFHTVAIKTDGTLWTWGLNGYGQLGNNLIARTSSPVQTISAGTNWKQVSAGRETTACIKTNGALWTWGNNAQGQLGINSIGGGRSSPVQTIAVGTNWKQVSCGEWHMTAVKTDGTLWVWGYNNYGQLGNGFVASITSPVQTAAGGTNWKQVSAGGYTTAAIKTDGTLWMWGRGTEGQLGDSTRTNKSSPVQTISGGTNWKQVSTHVNQSAAIKTDGTLWTWGLSFLGQLGDNTRDSKSSPIQTISGGTNWKQIVVGNSFMIAIRDDSADFGIGTM